MASVPCIEMNPVSSGHLRDDWTGTRLDLTSTILPPSMLTGGSEVVSLEPTTSTLAMTPNRKRFGRGLMRSQSDRQAPARSSVCSAILSIDHAAAGALCAY